LNPLVHRADLFSLLCKPGYASQALQAGELCDTELGGPELIFKIAQGTTSDLKPPI
jgi:hypothetical protein